MRNYLTFDNKDSRDFGVYINGQGTFRAPARSYNVLNIPGRNGDLLGFGSKLENVEITYRAFIYTNFDANIAALRSFLLSHVGYFKMTDSYHPDEYRLAYYKGPFVPDVVANNGAGSFDLTFVCKPQRFLNSGEEVTTLTPAGAEQHTYQGEIVNFSTLAGDKITSALADFHPIQDLHGYDHPWPGGGGKNLIEPWPNAVTTSGITVEFTENGEVWVHGTPTIQSGYISFSFNYFPNSVIGKEITISVNEKTVGIGFNVGSSNGNLNMIMSSTSTSKTGTYTATGETAGRFTVNVNYGVGTINKIYKVQFEIGSSATTWSPYSNICPISGRTGLSVFVGPTTAQADATTYSVDWTTEAGTVYGGTLDVVTGVLTVDRASVLFDGSSDETWYWHNSGVAYGAVSGGIITDATTQYDELTLCDKLQPSSWASRGRKDNSCGMFYGASYVFIRNTNSITDAATARTWLAANPITVIYPLATPLTYQLTAQEIEALADNYMWSDVGQVTVTVTDAMTIENPTLFDAKPLLRVYGAGTLTLGGQTITISTADVYTDIDCEMMDCFKDTVSKNGNVSFSGYDFPVIPPGRNVITMDGVTQVDITPRWWAA